MQENETAYYYEAANISDDFLVEFMERSAKRRECFDEITADKLAFADTRKLFEKRKIEEKYKKGR